MSALEAQDRGRLAELVPVLRRCIGLDPATVARLWLDADTTTVLVRLPFAVLVSRAVAVDVAVDVDVSIDDRTTDAAQSRDITVEAAQTLDWFDGVRADLPESRDADWRGGTPPRAGWRRLETVPDSVIRPLVRSGALALKEAAIREGVPGAQPRAEVADALLDAVVLTVHDDNGPPTEVTLRPLSALTRMGFLAKGGTAGIDVSGRWVRIAGRYGSVYAEHPGSGLTLR